MTRNVGGIDRILRAAVGVALLLWSIVGVPASEWSYLGWLGIVPLLTAAIGWCPAYVPFGIKTCRTA